MGNPHVHHAEPGPHVAAEIMPHPQSGILSWCTADVWGDGLRQLPQPGPEHAGQPPRVVIVRSERFGPVRMTFECWSYKHHRSRFWSWRAIRADAVMLKLKTREVRWLDDYWWPGRVVRA